MQRDRDTLCVQRDALRKELTAVRSQIRKIDEHAKQERAAQGRKKLRDTIRLLGGKKAFILRYGQGKFLDEPRRVGYCASNWIMHWYDRECALLGVPHNTERVWCRHRASQVRDGMSLCSRHAKEMDRTAELRRKTWGDPLPPGIPLYDQIETGE